jgi:predicted acetyltransferase
MSASKLVKPSVDYKDSYLEALAEFQAEGRYEFLKISEIEADFPQFIEDIRTGKRHLHKPHEDWVEPVPETILWLVKETQYIGTLNIRHRLNWHLEKWGGHINFLIRPSMRGKGFGKKILQKGRPFAAYLGVDKALLTVAPDNERAIRIIEFCGGEYQDELPETGQFPARKRYWLDCL